MLGQLIALTALAFAQGSQSQPLKVMPLGDSITLMWSNHAPESFTQKASVPVQLVGSLNHAEGHGGYTTGKILKGLPDWLSQNPPDVVLLQIGTNDIAAKTATDRSIGAIDSILDKIQADPDVRLCLVAGVTRLEPDNSIHQSVNVVDDFNSALASNLQQKSWTKIHFVGQCPLTDEEMAKDGLHPNKAGWSHLGTWWAEQLNANLKSIQ